MTWSFEIPGQPVSWNASYKIGVGYRAAYNRRGGEFRKIIKTNEAVTYTEMVTVIARQARPSSWKPEGFIVVEFDYYLGRDVDCDNVMKLVNDGLKHAIEVDDRWYLPRAMSKQTGLRPSERRVVVRVRSASPSSAQVASAPSQTLSTSS